VYDQILGKQNYLAGESLTLADLFHLTYGGSETLTWSLRSAARRHSPTPRAIPTSRGGGRSSSRFRVGLHTRPFLPLPTRRLAQVTSPGAAQEELVIYMQMMLAVTAAEQQCQLAADCIRTDPRVLAQTHAPDVPSTDRRSRREGHCPSAPCLSSSLLPSSIFLSHFLCPFLPLPSVVDDGCIERTSEKVHGIKGFDL
jgi:hypothetical protein